MLITGGTGLLGQALLATAGGGYQINVLHRRNYSSVRSNGVEECVLDILDRNQLDDLFSTHCFDVVIHAAGIANVDHVERNFEEGWESNVIGTQNIVSLACKKNIRLVYISSNAVFDGTRAPYSERDATNPINRYGRIKAECESIVARSCPDAVIVRPILMYGWQHPQGRHNPVTWIIERLQRGEKLNLVTDVYENPLWSYQCAEAIWRTIQMGKNGVFHLAGKEVVNRYELARMVAQVFDLDSSLLNPVDSSFFPTIAPRPRNTSFVTERMQEELEMDPLPLFEGLIRMRLTAGLQVLLCE